MTNTPSPDEDRELIERLRRTQGTGVLADGTLVPVYCVNPDGWEAADRLESLLSDRAKLARRVRMLANHGRCSCAECKDLDALNRSTVNNPQR